MNKEFIKQKEMKILTPKPNWNGWINWQILHKSEILSCCDCGLAHEFKFKSVKGKLMWRAKRHKETTKNNRKKYKTMKSLMNLKFR